MTKDKTDIDSNVTHRAYVAPVSSIESTSHQNHKATGAIPNSRKYPAIIFAVGGAILLCVAVKEQLVFHFIARAGSVPISNTAFILAWIAVPLIASAIGLMLDGWIVGICAFVMFAVFVPVLMIIVLMAL